MQTLAAFSTNIILNRLKSLKLSDIHLDENINSCSRPSRIVGIFKPCTFSQYNPTLFPGGEPDEDTEEFLELQEKLKNPEKMTRLEKYPVLEQGVCRSLGLGAWLCYSQPLFFDHLEMSVIVRRNGAKE